MNRKASAFSTSFRRKIQFLSKAQRYTAWINSGKFVITSEIAPPKGTNLEKTLHHIELLKDKVDGLNVTDHQSSVMRFCSLLGYDGYASLVREIQQTIQAELGSYGKFELASQLKSIKVKGSTPLELIVMDEVANLTDIIKNVKLDEFDRCVEMINRADHVVVVGCMLSKMLAYYLHMGLSRIVKSTHLITYHEVDVDYIARKLSKNSVVITVSFPRYPKAHYEITGIMAQRGAKVVTITNSPASPVIPFSDIVFYLSNKIDSFTEAFAAPLVFIEALLTSLSQRNPEETNKNLISYDEYDLVYKFENTPSYDFERSQKNGANKSRQKRKRNSTKRK